MITIFYLPYLYVNFTRSILLEELKKRANEELCVCDVSTMEAKDIIKLATESSLLAVDISIIGAGFTKSKPTTQNAVWTNWRNADFYREISEKLLALARPRLCLELSRDPHGIGLAEYETRFDAIAYGYAKKPTALAALNPTYLGPELLGRFQTNQPTPMDVDWPRLRQQYPDYPEASPYVDPVVTWQKVQARYAVHIELPHCLAPTEILPKASFKVWDLCVAGAPYVTRKIARQSAGEARVGLAPYRMTDFVIRKGMAQLGKLASQEWTNRKLIELRRISQETFVKHARLNFVCGSELQYFVRKYLEIPASWSPMIAYPCVGLHDYGFVDGQNIVLCQPEEAGQIARKLLAQPKLRTHLAQNAWSTVTRLHTVQQRVSDFIECMRRLEKGVLKKAEFIDGRYEIG